MSATVAGHWADTLVARGACADAVEWARGQDIATAWETCERGDWMLWLIGTLAGGAPESAERKKLVAAAVDCARLALPIWQKRFPDDQRVADCLDVTLAWTRDDATLDDVRNARAYAAYAAYAASAAYASAAYAAAAAYASAAYAAYASAAYATRIRMHKECADVVRRHYPDPQFLRDALFTKAVA